MKRQDLQARHDAIIRNGAIVRQQYAAQTARAAMANLTCGAAYTVEFRIEMQRQAARDYATARDWMGLPE